MISKSLLVLSALIIFTASVQSSGAADSSGAASAPTDKPAAITADIIGTTGKKIGEVKVEQVADGVQFQVHVMGLTPGKHGIHIHSMGKCDTPDFKSAGSHFAKAGTHHGMQNPQGPHWGDLPNINVVHGMGMATFVDKSVTLAPGDNSLNKAGGTSLVIHAGEDDEKSDPSGNSGDKVACAVLAK